MFTELMVFYRMMRQLLEQLGISKEEQEKLLEELLLRKMSEASLDEDEVISLTSKIGSIWKKNPVAIIPDEKKQEIFSYRNHTSGNIRIHIMVLPNKEIVISVMHLSAYTEEGFEHSNHSFIRWDEKKQDWLVANYSAESKRNVMRELIALFDESAPYRPVLTLGRLKPVRLIRFYNLEQAISAAEQYVREDFASIRFDMTEAMNNRKQFHSSGEAIADRVREVKRLVILAQALYPIREKIFEV